MEEVKDYKQKIEELQKQQDEISKEINKYNKLISEENNKKFLEERNKTIGKCYFLVDTKKMWIFDNNNSNFKFNNPIYYKILDFDDEYQQHIAKCLVVKEDSISILRLPLFCQVNLFKSSTLQIKYKDRFIDISEEISQEVFEQKFNEILKKIKQNL
jgi:hypothetical protein